MSKPPPGCIINGLLCYKCNRNDFGNFNNSRHKHGAHVCWCKGIPSFNQTQLKSKRKRKSALNDYHCSSTKSFPFLMKQPPVDKGDIPLAFQFDDMANDTNNPPPCNNNDNIISIMLPADDEEDVTHCLENMSQHLILLIHHYSQQSSHWHHTTWSHPCLPTINFKLILRQSFLTTEQIWSFKMKLSAFFNNTPMTKTWLSPRQLYLLDHRLWQNSRGLWTLLP